MWRWEITEDAACDLEDIWDYVHSYSGGEGRADAVLDGLEALFDAICRNPYAHAIYRFPKTTCRRMSIEARTAVDTRRCIERTSTARWRWYTACAMWPPTLPASHSSRSVPTRRLHPAQR